MRRLLLLVVVALAVGVFAASAEVQRSAATRSGSGVESLASGGAAGAVFWTRGEIGQLAVDGSRVAVVTGNLAGSCDRIVVWTAPGKKFVTFEAHANCPPRAYQSSVYEVALGAGRVAWIEWYEANTEYLDLYAAKVSGGPSKLIVEIGDAAEAAVGQLFGAGALLAYNEWLICSLAHSGGEPTADCPVEGQVSGETLKWLSSAGRPRVKSGSRSLHLLAVGGGRMAVDSLWDDSATRTDSPTVYVLSASGALVATVPATSGDPPRALALSAARLVIQRRRTLEVRDPASGALVRTISLSSAAPLQLVGVNSKLALLSGPNRLVVVRLSDGRHAKIRLPDEARATISPVSPRLSEAGLFYAYNVTSTPAKGRIVYTPTQQLLARFR